MATHASIPAWEIPWTEEAGGLQFMGSQRWTRWSTTDLTPEYKVMWERTTASTFLNLSPLSIHRILRVHSPRRPK